MGFGDLKDFVFEEVSQGVEVLAAKDELGFKREGVELKRIYVVIEHNVFGTNEFDHVL